MLILYPLFYIKIKESLKMPGTYIAVKPMKITEDYLSNLYTINHDLHSTLIHSRKENTIPLVLKPLLIYIFKFIDYDLWGNILVAKFENSAFRKRHEELMRLYNFEYDYPKFIPHVTIDYEFDGHMCNLRKIDNELLFSFEYSEELKDE